MGALPSCKEVIGLLDDYLAGGLSADAAARFEEHLSRCPGCAAYLQSYREARRATRAALLRSDALPDVPEELVRAVLAARETEA
jgi:anti-sigma factor RsiW